MGPAFTSVEGGVVAPEGFLCSGVSAGIKKSGRRDVALLVAEKPCPSAAVFTTNSMAAAPVVVSREAVASGIARAVVTNSGNANACTGPQGIADAVAALDSADGTPAAEAIMTTDTFPKQSALSFEGPAGRVRVGGMAKGSGMIMPNMATMLAYVTTDAPLTAAACDAALRAAVGRTFNRISVDSDTSTNDMVVLMASGAAGGEPIDVDSAGFADVSSAIEEVCRELARMIVRDGEGATKLIEVTVQGAASEADAHEAAMSVANSPLFKTAVFGGDANWGRVVMAVGKSSAYVDPERIEVVFAGITVCKNGTGFAFDEVAASAALAEPEISVVVDLHVGEAQATVLTCDLSYEYVRINGDYRT